MTCVWEEYRFKITVFLRESHILVEDIFCFDQSHAAVQIKGRFDLQIITGDDSQRAERYLARLKQIRILFGACLHNIT